MNPDDDPEKRIQELERPLTDQAQTSELGTAGPPGGWPPPPPPGYYGPPMPPLSVPPPSSGLRIGWIVLALMVVGLIIGGGAILATSLFAVNRPGTPTISGGGGTFTTITSRPSRGTPVAPVPAPSTSAATVATPPPGGNLSVAGVDQNRRIACNDGVVTVSGVENTVVITGHCTRVTVSGMNNLVTVDAADAIDVSGIENKVTYRDGAPEISKSGFDNTVEQG
ncbi:DUF3060 domain-containing protein [Mycobacterium sp. shizuoka-1]|uniref:DUF3060 domain-containing protein n=1 Tax=Mycobacterium sp. shizuoka-1 TaxID=2039281 RepID=UPI000C064980|nr:DUF3060 domain-containing protein [Mycobacterium sp. shizuoka-1]GAY13654.1 membrane protein [Mycobacterium sp. shizuoka-1]